MEDLKTNKMLVSVVLDRSGSMEASRAGTISGFNEYLNGLRADKDSEYDITLIQFDANGNSVAPELTISYVDKPLAEVSDLTTDTYEPRGNTPLYDAIGECVRRVDAKNRSITMVIITDGMENASREFTRDAIKALLKEKEAEGWTVAFLGANIDSYAVGNSIGVSMANTSNYTIGNETVMYSAVASSTLDRARLNRTVGLRAAAARPLFTRAQQAAMAGKAPAGKVPNGGQPARPSFRPPAPQTRGEKRKWKVADAS